MKSLPLLLLALAAPVAGQSAPTPRVVLAVDGVAQTRNLPALVAERLGYFKDEGLTVTLFDGRLDVSPDKMVIDGRADGAVAFYHHTFEVQAAGGRAESVIALGMTPGLKLLVATRLHDRVKSLADLKGLKIITGGPDSGKTTAANWLVLSAGLALTDYTRLGLDTPEAMAKSLADGGADAIVAHEPDASYYRKQGVAYVFADLSTVAGTRKTLGTAFPTTCLYLNASYVEANPAIVQKLVNAFERALKYINAHTPQEVLAIVPKELVGKNPKTYFHDLREDLPMFATDGLMPADAAAMELKVMSSFQAKYRAVRLDDTYTNAFASVALKASAP